GHHHVYRNSASQGATRHAWRTQKKAADWNNQRLQAEEEIRSCDRNHASNGSGPERHQAKEHRPSRLTQPDLNDGVRELLRYHLGALLAK
ncbi:hypothetical protein, partial [Marinimicrobium sp. C2-29]|uniref:hypothetical protein n=1 Tax=Marinimicrobium sp. C2-29 TaxID=3139825 RepID=UPI003139FA0B